MMIGKKKILFFSLLIAVVSLLILPQIVFAQASLGVELPQATGLGTTDLKELIVKIVRIILGFLGIIAVLVVLYGGFAYLTSKGEAEKVATAKKVLVNGLIGLGVILSAFLIVSYVLRLMGESTGIPGEACQQVGEVVDCAVGQCPGTQTCGQEQRWGNCEKNDPQCNGRLVPPNTFTPSNILPRGNLSIRNVAVQATFNREVDPESVVNPENNLPQSLQVLKQVGDNYEAVAGTLELGQDNQRRLIFRPTAECPDHPGYYCLEANATYQVRVSDNQEVSLRSTNGSTITCGLDGALCLAEFTAGSLIDTELPSVNLTEAINHLNERTALAGNVYLLADEQYQLKALATDDAGVAQIDFYLAGGELDSVAPESPALEFEASLLWEASGYVFNRPYELKARVYDVALNNAWSPVINLRINPAHCFNGQQDQGEIGRDCGGDDCRPCDQGQEQGPVITEISPDNGAVGNWATIFGRNFGVTAGRVLVGGREAAFPNIQGCENNHWSNNQIIIALPQGLNTGNQQVQVITSNNQASNTFDFLINETVRPGICLVAPQAREVGANFNVRGVNFNVRGVEQGAQPDKDVYFGRPNEGISATNQFWASFPTQIVGAQVPNLSAGQTSVRVRVGDQDSNALAFTVNVIEQGPAGFEFEPARGAPGQYLTISGSGFGDSKTAERTVRFPARNQDGFVEANFDFPEECGTNYWTDNRLVVKVPVIPPDEVIANGAPLILMKDGQQRLSRSNFVYDAEVAVTPGICSLYPDTASSGQAVEIAGEPFSGATVNFSNIAGLRPEAGSTNNLIKLTIPRNVRSGLVTVVKDQTTSNAVPFALASERIAERREQPAYYQWQFTTCLNCLAPEVVERGSCVSGENASPAPFKYPRAGSQSAFIDQNIGVGFNTNMDNASFRPNQTFVLKDCGSTEDFNQNNCENVNLAGNFTFSEGSNEYVSFDPTNNLTANHWYQVTLTTGISSYQENPDAGAIERIPLAANYAWHFKTRANEALCTADQVNLLPQDRRTGSRLGPLERGQTVAYQAYGVNSGVCAICPDNFSWRWSSDHQNQAQLAEPQSSASRNNLNAVGFVVQPEVAGISAQITNAAPNPQGQALLNIVPGSPRVIINNQCEVDSQSPTPSPNSQESCVNAKISARFSLPMDEQSLVLGEDNVGIYQCADGACENRLAGSLELLPQNYGNQQAIGRFNFTPNSPLATNSWYEVRLGSEVKSAEGASLVGLRSWRFKTRASAQACQFASVLVNPGQAVLSAPQTTQNYQADGLGQSCQLLNIPGSVWQWHSEDASIATIDPQSPRNQTVATAGNTQGQIYIRAQTGDIVNRGDNGRLVVRFGPDQRLSLTNHQPTGESVCLNALARAQFNFSLEANAINGQNFKVYQNNNNQWTELASRLSANRSRDSLSLLPDTENQRWLANTQYKIVIQGGANGIASGQLRLAQAGCSADWSEQEGNCSWTFQTGETTCRVDRVEISPTSTVNYLSDTQDWEATAYSEDNQPLANQPTWSAEPAGVANLNVQANSRYLQTESAGLGRTWLSARADNVAGRASLTVRERLHGPRVENIEPANPPLACRNSLINLTFDQQVDENTINNDNLEVLFASNNDLGNCQRSVAFGPARRLAANILEKLFNVFINPLLSKVITRLEAADNFDVFRNDFGNNQDQAFMNNPGQWWCSIQGNNRWSWVNQNGKTQASFYPERALPAPPVTGALAFGQDPPANIKVVIKGGENGIKGINSLPLEANDNYELNNEGQVIHSFRTTDNICQLSFVQVLTDEPKRQSDWLFTSSHNNEADDDYQSEEFDKVNNDSDKVYIAAGYSVDGQRLVSLPGIYEWQWRWQSANTTVAILSDNQNYYPENHDNSYKVVLAGNKNGESEIKAQAIFPPFYGKENLTGAGQAQVELCENPWPSFVQNRNFKYFDDNYKFALSYCRDSGDGGKTDDLPELEYELEGGRVTFRGNPSYDNQDDLLKEYLIPVPGADDVIGLRVYSNYYHLDPLSWYRKNIPTEKQGSPQSLTVDGYPAIQDGRTIYIGATSVNYQQGAVTQAFTNIFLLSYNSGAAPETQEIFKQLAEKWQFNTNVPEPEVKQKIQRDVRRLLDFAAMTKALAQYQDNNGYYPALSGGSFIGGMSISKWPSWDQTLGPALGISLPKDPLNVFGACVACDNQADPTCGYDPNTCWNPLANNAQGGFACDAASAFYRYQHLLRAVQGQNAVSNYFLAAKMEMPIPEDASVESIWWPQNRGDYVFFDSSHLRLRTDYVEGCSGEVINQVCGNGVVERPEEACEPGQLKNWCDLGYEWHTPQVLGCQNNCQWQEPQGNYPAYCHGYCSDGVYDNNYEGCDATAPVNRRGYRDGNTSQTNQYACSASCEDIGGWCGDDLVQNNYNEQCDGSAAGWDCPTGQTAQCTGCRVSCSGGGTPYQGVCGNDRKEGTEQCDGTDKPPHTTCNDTCQLTGCEGTWRACDSQNNDVDGCEINVQTDRFNCGACSTQDSPRQCQTYDNTITSCVSGSCSNTCDPYGSYRNCDNVTPQCETNVLTTVRNCGECATNGGDDCLAGFSDQSIAQTNVVCSAGACGYSCKEDYFVDCDDDNEACEVDLRNDVNNCNACGTVCPAPGGDPAWGDPTCASGNCGLMCFENNGYKLAGNQCVVACGDNVVDNRAPLNEQCDKNSGDLNNPNVGQATCHSVDNSFQGGTLYCSAACEFDTRGCCTSNNFSTSFTADNYFQLWVNGNAVFTDLTDANHPAALFSNDGDGDNNLHNNVRATTIIANGEYVWKRLYTFTSQLRNGANVIAVKAIDSGADRGLIGKFSCGAPTGITTNTDGRWKCTATNPEGANPSWTSVNYQMGNDWVPAVAAPRSGSWTDAWTRAVPDAIPIWANGAGASTTIWCRYETNF